jgi:hypothetical protein
MDPSQGNTSGLVMTNHLYRLIRAFICPFTNVHSCCSSTQDDILTKLRTNKKTKVRITISLHSQAVSKNICVLFICSFLFAARLTTLLSSNLLPPLPAKPTRKQIPESYLPKTCVHQWEGHTKVESTNFWDCFHTEFILGRQLHSMVTQVGSFVTQCFS